MANCCPRTCSRLATAAAFISIGIIQFIAGLVLLRSKYVSLLSGPNFWTAAANIAVGGLLGISSAIWRTTNKKSMKHVSRRNVLAALVSSGIILNGTTTAILVVGEGNILLSIHLESDKIYSSTMLATEILGYAYGASVCSPIVAVVIAVAFLLGLCFQVNSHKSKKLNIKNTVRENVPDIYSWVYPPKLPRPDLDVMRMAASSSGSGTSSDSDSACSADIPVLLRSRTPAYSVDRPSSTRDKVSYRNETLHDPIEQGTREISSLRSNCSRSNKVTFSDSEWANRTILSVPNLHNKILSSSSSMSDTITTSATQRDQLMKRKRSRARPKILFEEYPSGETLNHSDRNESLKNISANNSGILKKRDTHFQREATLDSLPRVHNTNFNTAQKKSREFPMSHKESFHSPESIDDFPQYHHRSLLRTSTTDDSKFIETRASPEDSEICCDSVFVAKDIRHNESREHDVKSVSFGKDFSGNNSFCRTRENPLPREMVPLSDSDFRAKLSAKLVPVPTPVISNNYHWNPKAPRKYSPSPTQVHTNTKYDGYLHSSFSSFRKMQMDDSLNEFNVTKYDRGYNSLMKSPMDSISELPTEEINEQLLTSAHTSGYMSALDESGDHSREMNTSNRSRKQSSTVEHPYNSYRTENKKSVHKNMKSPDFHSLTASHDNSVEKAIENFATEHPDITVDDLVSHLLQTTV